MTNAPPVKPSSKWRPYHYIGQFGGSMHIDQLPDISADAYQVILNISNSNTSLSAREIAMLASAYRQAAIMTTTILVNAMTR